MTAATSYDELPYSCFPLHLTHPDNLACKAWFYGLAAPDPTRCRMLELGCGDGTNLLSLARILPHSSFTGIDYSARQIASGQAKQDRAGISNLELKTMSLADVDRSLGEFDYIVCHGVYSWVAPDMQQHILRIVRELLAERGVGYVSYNVYPGWHFRGMIRDMLCYQVRGMTDPQEKVRRARGYLEFLIHSAPDPESAYVQVLKWEQKTLDKAPDTYVFHEHLEEVNQPLYFHQFIERAQGAGLQYLSEATFPRDMENLSAEVVSRLSVLRGEKIEYEQQLDFLLNNAFRRSLLVHRGITLSPVPVADQLTSLSLSTRAVPVNEQVDFTAGTAEEFRDASGATITTTHQLVKCVLLCLAEIRPRFISFEDLLTATRNRLGCAPAGNEAEERELFASALYRCHHCGLIDLMKNPPAVIYEASERPQVHPLVRVQAIAGEPVSNLVHRVIDVSRIDRFVLSLLDGTRDRTMLMAELSHQLISGALPVAERDGIGDVTRPTPQEMGRLVERSLQKFASLHMFAAG